MNYDILAFVILIAILSLIMYKNRKKLIIQKILYPVVYMILYKTHLGIGLMNKISERHRKLVITIAYCFVGFAFAGMIFMSYTIVKTMINFVIAPATTDTGMALLYPGTTIAGIGYLSFWYWFIGLFCIAIVHEMAHGIVAVANKIKIKSSGFAVLGIIAPLFPAAFVEPDDKQMSKRPAIEQYSVLAAGPMINLVIALLLFAVMPYVADSSSSMLAPFESRITVPKGFSFDINNASMPAGISGLSNNTLITSVNGVNVTDADKFIEVIYYCTKPEETITLANENATYAIKTIASPAGNGRAYIGIENIRNVRAVSTKDKIGSGAFFWFKGLFRWLFLLNFFIGLSNLLPIFITDGATMLKVACLDTIKDKKKALKVWALVNWLFLGLIMLGLVATYVKRFFF